MMSKKRYYLTILVLGSLTALVPFSIDMYLPGFKAIASDFNVSSSQVPLTLSSFFIGVCVGQLFYGPLMDRFGRKTPLYIGIGIYVVMSLLCTIVNSFEAFVVFRFLQAIGACAAAVAATAMVRDIFPVEDNAKVFSMLMLVLSASPLIAPTAGGYMTASLGWHSVFLALAGISILIALGIFVVLKETRKPDPSYSLKPAAILGNFLTVIRQPQFFTYAMAGSIGFAGLFVYVSNSPFLFLEIYKISEETFGLIFALLAVGVIGATQVNRLLLKKFSSMQIIQAALISQTIISALLLFVTYSGWAGLTSTIVLIFLFLACVGLILPNTSALCMAPFEKNAGSASALMGALQMGIGSLATTITSVFSGGIPSATPMMAVMAACAVLALLLLVSGKRFTKAAFWQQQTAEL